MKTPLECRRARERLTAAGEPSAALAEHLAACGACARFAERLDVARSVLRAHHAGIEPDAGFAARVTLRLPAEPAVALGWAAARLLPVTLVLALVLAWFALQTAPALDTAATATESDDVLEWILDTNGEGS